MLDELDAEVDQQSESEVGESESEFRRRCDAVAQEEEDAEATEVAEEEIAAEEGDDSDLDRQGFEDLDLFIEARAAGFPSSKITLRYRIGMGTCRRTSRRRSRSSYASATS